ncbi:MAG: helix-turn-helix domain-containing protein [Clostridia bacterium]|nr:helix-turn-helix domain-containing protein [Clostridia bacterium]
MINKLTRYDYIKNGFIHCDARTIDEAYVPTHWHDFFEIEYIISGSGDYIIDGKKYTIAPGMTFFMSPINAHMVIAHDVQLINISFSENLCDSFLLSQLDFVDSVTAFRLEGADRDYIKTTALELSHSLDDNLYASLLLNTIVTKLHKIFTPQATLRNNFSISKKAVLYIINNFRKNISLADAASYVGLTPSYFSMLFKKETGTTFKEYIDRLRFEYARKLILLSDMTVQQICAESGFGNYENFIRRFKLRFGSSPSIYRTKNKQ